MKLYIRQDYFSIIGQTFGVQDENGKEFLRVVPRFSIIKKYRIYDKDNNLLLSIRKRPFRFLKTYQIKDADGNDLAIVKKLITFLKAKFKIKSNVKDDESKYEVKGDMLNWHYTLNKDDKPLCQISKKILKLTDHYELDIFDDDEMLFCIAVVVCIDAAIHHKRGGSKFKFPRLFR